VLVQRREEGEKRERESTLARVRERKSWQIINVQGFNVLPDY